MISMPKIKEPPTTSTRYEGIHQLYAHTNTTDVSAQPRCTSLPDRRATTKQRAVQLRIFALDGAWAEPYVPARAGNDAAMSAAAGEGRAQ